MTYEETLDYLFTSIPVFQRSGASAYKPGLDTSIALDNYLGNPHTAYKTIHVGGTNGKGSTSHLLAAILQQAGYKVGLFTSPHLVDFRERIRVNGICISKEYVINFIEKYRSLFEPHDPSFFELTSTMALAYFRDMKVDYAIIEVGLGGRLDSTNIITPILSVITNISKDHVQFLGDTLEAIASEKAGIIKPGVPVVIGDVYQPEVMQVFQEKAEQTGSPLFASMQMNPILSSELGDDGQWHYQTRLFGTLTGELGGKIQEHNTATVLAAIEVLNSHKEIQIPESSVKEGFAHVVELTGLMGRWQKLHDAPKVICDTGHNTGGWEYLSQQLTSEAKRCKRLRMVVGMVNDKDINGVLAMMPKNAVYYFTQASIPRAMPTEEFAQQAAGHGLVGNAYGQVTDAVQQAMTDASPEDFIFIGGSTFIVADALEHADILNLKTN